jgi:hypothetical protein
MKAKNPDFRCFVKFEIILLAFSRFIGQLQNQEFERNQEKFKQDKQDIQDDYRCFRLKKSCQWTKNYPEHPVYPV